MSATVNKQSTLERVCSEEPDFQCEQSLSSKLPASFYDLVKLPNRQRSTTRKRQKQPSNTLTSDEHFQFLLEKSKKCGKKQISGQGAQEKKQQNTKNKRATNKNTDSKDNEVEPCVYGFTYGEPSDPHATDEWISCATCHRWFHETCGEDNGLHDDDIFLCKNCCE